MKWLVTESRGDLYVCSACSPFSLILPLNFHPWDGAARSLDLPLSVQLLWMLSKSDPEFVLGDSKSIQVDSEG